METIDIIGLFGAFLSGVTFFPQVYRTWKLKSARDLSLTMVLIILLSNVVWLIYAFEKRSSKKAPPPANYQFQCLLSDVYEKNDSFKIAYKHATTKSYQ